MGTCACRGGGDRQERDRNRNLPVKEPRADYVFLSDLPPAYEYHSHIPPPPTVPNFPTFVAKYDYERQFVDDLSFKKGDLLYIIGTERQDWWYAQHKETGVEGLVPSNYITQRMPLEDEE